MPPRLTVKDRNDGEADEPDKDKNDGSEHGKSWRRSWRSASPLTKLNIILTGVIAGSTLTYALFAGWQLIELGKSVNIAHETFVAANRPYIGVNDFQLGSFEDKTPKKRGKAFVFRAQIKNFGPVPGGDFVGSWKGFFGGVEIEGTRIADKPSTLFPGQVVFLTHTVYEPDYTALMNGQKILMIEITVEYAGPSGRYKYCERHQYAPDVNSFLNLGAC